MKHWNMLLSAILAGVWLPNLSAQTLIQIGGAGGLSDIRAGLAVAQPGDELVVQPGSYPYFFADVGVTIRAAIPGTVDVFLDAASVPAICGFACLLEQGTRIEPPAGQATHLEGLNFRGPQVQVGSFLFSHRVRMSGRVSMRDCTIESEISRPLTIHSGSDVHLHACTVSMDMQLNNTSNLWANVMEVTSSRVTAVDCQFLKLDDLTLSTPAVVCANSTFHASGITIQRTGGPAHMHALQLDNSTAWICDSQLNASTGACAVVSSAGQLFVDRTTIVGASGCLTGQAGGARLGVSDVSPPTAGAPYSATYRTTPNTLVGVFFALSLEVSVLPQVIAQPIWLPLATSQPAALLLADASGVATATWQLPNLPGSLRPQLWIQAVSGDLPLQVSPAVGGVVR